VRRGHRLGRAGLPLPELAQITLSRMGGAAIVLGLLASAPRSIPRSSARMRLSSVDPRVKLFALPAIVWGCAALPA